MLFGNVIQPVIRLFVAFVAGRMQLAGSQDLECFVKL